MNSFEKSPFPSRRPIGGMITSLTSEEMMRPNASPMMIPTAMSTTLPRMANSLSSLNILSPSLGFESRGLYVKCGQGEDLHRGRPPLDRDLAHRPHEKTARRRGGLVQHHRDGQVLGLALQA